MPDIVVMFFLLGLIAGLVRSDLSVPKAAYDMLGLLLMLTIGLKGGMALYGNIGWRILPELLTVIMLGILIPVLLFPVLRKAVGLNLADSASIAAHYGSVSAGTFAVALAYVGRTRSRSRPKSRSTWSRWNCPQSSSAYCYIASFSPAPRFNPAWRNCGTKRSLTAASSCCLAAS